MSNNSLFARAFRSLSSQVLRVSAFLMALALLPTQAHADVFRVGDYVLQRGGELGAYELSVSIPEPLATNAPLGLPEQCHEEQRDKIVEVVTARYIIMIECEGDLPYDAEIVTPWGVDGGTFSSTAGEKRLRMAVQAINGTLSLPMVSGDVPARPLPQIATYYTWQGVLHILGGWDHLAFVLCLCLLARGRMLIGLVTTFTIGHSISLALAFFDVITLPVPAVEAIIALSIAFMAREAVLKWRNPEAHKGQDKRQLVVVSAFGLLHGLGFATVLKELGVAPAERVSGLLFFNAGVELGQLIFVGFVALAMLAARKISLEQPLRSAALYGAGIIGCFWAYERVIGFTLGAV